MTFFFLCVNDDYIRLFYFKCYSPLKGVNPLSGPLSSSITVSKAPLFFDIGLGGETASVLLFYFGLTSLIAGLLFQ